MLRLFLAVLVLTAGGAAFALRGDRSFPVIGDQVDSARDEVHAIKRAVARERAPLPTSRCPSGLSGCRSVSGRIVFVEAVDPDGDGDLHVVIAGGSVTAPGLSAIDVRAGLRPSRDPKLGDRASAAGQVQTGSHGQSQIHAVEFHTQ